MHGLSMNGNTCACGNRICSRWSWDKLAKEQRVEVRAAGIAAACSSTKCQPCATRDRTRVANRSRSVPAEPSEQYTRAEAISEWLFLRNPLLSQHENIEWLAPRMGLSYGALRKHLDRAIQRGELIDSLVAAA